MRAIIQRVSKASVCIEGKRQGAISYGLLILLRIEESDTEKDIEWLVKKIIQLRIFSDNDGKINLSLQDIQGEILLISQFTLFASTKKGNRPSFIRSAKPEIAIPLYAQFIEAIEKSLGKKIQTGIFGANMQVELINDGPVTIILDSKKPE